MIREFSVDTGHQKVEDYANDRYAGENEIVAVEVFDAPSSRFSPKYDTEIGPWMVGPPEEVFARLAERRWFDFEVQHHYEPPAVDN